ncbi:hypothetical protein H9Q09_00955 [Aurantimonas sp. DM33-3]|uniref:hypothetical protein n=1 Tax=Aurantimonas sp. DM33-3 TaxID=2766955 RepID=UPI001652219D|nr:hypothetical protein [Aurantimonas sp. DM33-3]MBC6714753.1 hypothetical protein [Aurantimonas sp. DM33-3]
MAGTIEERKRKLRDGGWQPHPQASMLRPVESRPRSIAGLDFTDTETVVKDGELRVEAIRVFAIVNENSDAFSHLVVQGWLKRNHEAQSTADIRAVVANRYRSLRESSQVSALKGQSYEPRMSVGGGGGRSVSDHALDSIRVLERINQTVADHNALVAVQQVLWEDRWIWAGKKGKAATRQVNRVLRGLDHLAASFGYITPDEVRLRWTAD